MNTNAIRLDTEPTAGAAAAQGSEPRDAWESVSGTVIQRFLDYYWVRYGVSHETLHAYRTDLVALDRWMQLFRKKTLVTASGADIREFLNTKYDGASRSVNIPPSLSCIKRFYFYLLEGGFRADDPTENVFVRTPRLVRHDLSIIQGAPASANRS